MAHGNTSVKPPVINVMTRAVFKAAKGLVRDFGEVEYLQVSKKGPADFVTAADIKAEKVLHEELEKARPNCSFLMEESGHIKGEDETYTWIVDPLDGTMNFLHGLPHFCITIALQKHDEIVAAVTYDPLRDEMFWAEKGGGAYMNDRRIRVAGRIDFSESLISVGLHHTPKPGERRIGDFVGGIRYTGSAALDLAYVASGRFDGFCSDRLKAWDMAAGVLIVREAGGIVSDLKGGQTMLDSGTIVAGNLAIHESLIKVVPEQD